MPTHRFLPFLALLSGVSGIAYEVLYVRLLTAYVGNIFYVSAVLLSTFLLGIALGSFLSNSYVRHLKHIELAIGIYALVLAALFGGVGLGITELLASMPFPDAVSLSLFVFLILAFPATAIGFSMPLFAQYIDHYKSHDRKTFSFTYAVYNVGAAISVIAIEYAFVWHMGITSSVAIVAAINIGIAVALHFIDSPPEVLADRATLLLKQLDPVARRQLIAVFIASTASGIMQFNLFSFFQYIIGPLNENFALLVGTSLISITVASLLVRVVGLKLFHGIALTALLSIVPLVFTEEVLLSYIDFFEGHSDSPAGVIVSRVLVICSLALPVFIAFGTTIPAMVREQGIRLAGLVLAASCIGNALGYLLFTFGLYSYVAHISTAILVAGVMTATLVWLLWSEKKQAAIYGVIVLAVVASASWSAIDRFPPEIYKTSYANFFSRERFERIKQPVETLILRKYGSDAVIHKYANGDRKLFFHGYQSLTFRKDQDTVLRESLVGSTPAFFTPKHDRALVFGLGTGITAGATAASYKELVVAEVNPAMIDAAGEFPVENDHIFDKEHVSVVIQDGLITLLSSEGKYDAIVNTVPSPRFFSANKLWTLEVFQAARERLNPGGVFVGWVDSRLGRSGMQIMESTLNKAFEDCNYVYLASGYMAFVCSNQELSVRDIDDAKISPVLVRTIGARSWAGPAHEFVRHITFKGQSDRIGNFINSLDWPLLEFESTYGDENEQDAEWFTEYLVDYSFGERSKAKVCAAMAAMMRYHLLRDDCLDTTSTVPGQPSP